MMMMMINETQHKTDAENTKGTEIKWQPANFSFV